MVSNAFTRRRHVMPAPAVCHPPPPPYHPPPYVVTCTCSVAGNWDDINKVLEIGVYANYLGVPPDDPITVWVYATPPIDTTPPWTFANGHAYARGPYQVPPGTKQVILTAAFQFSDGNKCGAYKIVSIP